MERSPAVFTLGWEAARKDYPAPPRKLVDCVTPDGLTAKERVWFVAGWYAWISGDYIGKGKP